MYHALFTSLSLRSIRSLDRGGLRQATHSQQHQFSELPWYLDPPNGCPGKHKCFPLHRHCCCSQSESSRGKNNNFISAITNHHYFPPQKPKVKFVSDYHSYTSCIVVIPGRMIEQCSWHAQEYIFYYMSGPHSWVVHILLIISLFSYLGSLCGWEDSHILIL